MIDVAVPLYTLPAVAMAGALAGAEVSAVARRARERRRRDRLVAGLPPRPSTTQET